MIIGIIGVIIGILLLAAGLYYFLKEKDDAEARKIYLVVMAVGLIIIVAALIKLFI